MIVKEINNVATVVTDYYSTDVIETIALIPRTMFAHCDRHDLSDINLDDEIKEIKVNNKRYILKNIIEEEDYFIFQMDEID